MGRFLSPDGADTGRSAQAPGRKQAPVDCAPETAAGPRRNTTPKGASMGIFDRLKHELIDIIEFLDDSNNTLVFRFERFNNEIKNGAKLVVREGQSAVFINEGRLADVFGRGPYTLSTATLPILATLKGWKY